MRSLNLASLGLMVGMLANGAVADNVPSTRKTCRQRWRSCRPRRRADLRYRRRPSDIDSRRKQICLPPQAQSGPSIPMIARPPTSGATAAKIFDFGKAWH